MVGGEGEIGWSGSSKVGQVGCSAPGRVKWFKWTTVVQGQVW